MTTYLYACKESLENFEPFDGQEDAVQFIDEHDDMDLRFRDRPKARKLDKILRRGDRVLMFVFELEEQHEINATVRWERRGVTVDFLRPSYTPLTPEDGAEAGVALFRRPNLGTRPLVQNPVHKLVIRV